MRRHLELAIEGAQLGVWSYNPHTGSCWFSDRSKELWGLDDNLIPDARELLKVIHPDDRDAQLEPFYDRFPDEPAGIEYRIVRPDGETRWIYALGAAARDENGEPQAVHGIHLDVSDRKQAEGDLEIMRRHLELAIEGAQLGVWSYDPRAGSCWFSDRSKALLGLDDNFMRDARDLEKVVHPDDWERLAAPYYGRFPDEPLAVEFRVPRPNGGITWIYALGDAARDEQGEPQAVHGIHIDITDRKKAEGDLEMLRKRLHVAMDGAKLGVWSFDPINRTVWYSNRSREIYSLGKDEKPTVAALQARVHPDDWPRLAEPIYNGFPEEPLELEYRVLRPDGEVRWVYALGAATRDAQGVTQAVHGIHIDITDRKRAEEELARSRDALVQSEKLVALGALLAGVSHELNNPLAAIVGQAEMLAEDSQGTAFEERAKRIGAAAERCARIVQTFLTMARQGERQTALVNLNDVIASALELTDYTLRTAGIAVRVNFGSGLPPVEGDRDQLHQVLVNLIVNSQQAMEKGEAFEKVLTIRTSVNQAGRVLVDVTDTGPGVPEDLRRRIFEPFFTTKKHRVGSGTGIGLSFRRGSSRPMAARSRWSRPPRRPLPDRPPRRRADPDRAAPTSSFPTSSGPMPLLIVEDSPTSPRAARADRARGFRGDAGGQTKAFALDKGDFDLFPICECC